MRAPSKKVSITFLTAIVIITIVMSLSSLANKKINNTSSNETSRNISVNINLDNTDITDSDGDGLLDWEETLWGTDINNPDSDGDGTNDGEETDLNRNPIISGPDDDNYDFEEKIIEDLYAKGVDEDSLTNKATVAFINTYLELKRDGNLTEENKQRLVSEIVNASFDGSGLIDLRTPYTTNSVKTFPNATQEEILEYAQKMFEIQNESISLISISSSQNNYLKTLEAFNNLSKQLIKIPAPESIKEIHLELANGYYLLGQSVAFMNANKDDPIISTFGFNFYKETLFKIGDTGSEFSNFLTENGIFNDNGVLKIK